MENFKLEVKDKKEGLTSLEKAREIMGESMYGAEEIREIFGGDFEIPPVQFSIEELERAKSLGQELVLYIDTTSDGKPLTISEMLRLRHNRTSRDQQILDDFDENGNKRVTFGGSLNSVTETVAERAAKTLVAENETPRVGWRLNTQDIIPETLGTRNTIIEKYGNLIAYVEKQVFVGGEIPAKYIEAIQEFKELTSSQPFLDDINSSSFDPRKEAAVEKLYNLKLNELLTENFSEALYRYILKEAKNGEATIVGDNTRLLTNTVWKDGHALSLKVGRSPVSPKLEADFFDRKETSGQSSAGVAITGFSLSRQ